MKSQVKKATPWASQCTLRLSYRTALQVLEVKGYTSKSASWLPTRIPTPVLNIQSLTTKGQIEIVFRVEIDPSLGSKLTCVFSNCSCMIDSKANQQSKFLTGSSKMAQKFSVGALVFKDLVTPSSTSQVPSVKWAVYLSLCPVCFTEIQCLFSNSTCTVRCQRGRSLQLPPQRLVIMMQWPKSKLSLAEGKHTQVEVVCFLWCVDVFACWHLTT